MKARPASTPSPSANDAEKTFPPSGNTLTWLHLADLGYRADIPWDKDAMRNALVRDVFRFIVEEELDPDLVLVSGSIARFGQPGDYEQAEKGIKDLASALRITPAKGWAIVPGVGDVTADKIGPSARHMPLSDSEFVNTLLTQSTALFMAEFSSRLDPFCTFASKLLGSRRSWGLETPWQVESFSIRGFRIAVLALDSVWAYDPNLAGQMSAGGTVAGQTTGSSGAPGHASGGSRPPGHPLVGRPQLVQALEQVDQLKPDFKIALLHHPVDYLQEHDQQAIRELLDSSAGPHVRLFSHLSGTPANLHQTPNRHYLEVRAGCCACGESREPVINLVQLDLERRRGLVHVWRYTNSGGGFWARDNLSCEGMEGRWSFDFPADWFEKKSTPKPRPPRESSEKKPIEVWRRHLEYTLSRNQFIELLGIQRTGGALRIPLEQVYVELRAESGEAGEKGRRARDSAALERKRSSEDNVAMISDKGRATIESDRRAALECEGMETYRPLSLHDALARSPRAAIIGDPGSGKTTLLRYVAQKVAQGWLEPRTHAEKTRKLLGLEAGATLPIPILTTLGSLDRFLKTHPPSAGRPGIRHFVAFLRAELDEELACLDPEVVEEALEQGRLLVLLDGLDEVPGHADRMRVARAVAELATLPALRIVLTSRTRAYDTGLGGQLSDLAPYRLQPMSWDEVSRFLEMWHGAVFPEDPVTAARKARELFDEIRSHREVAEMANNPNILTLIAILKHTRTKLPERRVELYGDTIDLFLERKDLARGIQEGTEDIGQDLTLREKRKLLAQLALEMHRGGEKGRTVSVKLPVMCFARQLLLSERCATEAKALQAGEQLLDWLELRSGLLVRGDQGVRFAHLAYQEHLCALGLSDFVSEARIWEEIRGHLDDDWWNEPIRLLLALLESRAEPLLLKLSGAEDVAGQSMSWKRRGRGLALAMGGLQDIPPMLVAPEIREKVTAQMALLTGKDTRVVAKDRIEALLALGKVGDPRLGMEKKSRWVWVEPGELTSGETGQRAKIAEGFWLGKYPVTNGEYEDFLKAGGYREEGLAQWWSEEGRRLWKAFCGGQKLKEFWDRERGNEYVEGPRYWMDSQWNAANQPVVGVSWYEAEAYCRWLTATWRLRAPEWLEAHQAGRKWPGFEIKLPTEAEWEYSARGAEGLEYPWGAAVPNTELANYDDGKVGATSAVGAYPKGEGPFGALDQAGNVWEWCTDDLGNADRALRGGSWANSSRVLRGSCRDWLLAGNRVRDIGFRCVLCSCPRAGSG